MSRMAELHHEQQEQEAERDLEMCAWHQQDLERQERDLYEAERKVREILKQARIRPLFAVEVSYLVDHITVRP